MNLEKLLGYVESIERYANDLKSVSFGYSKSLMNIAEGIRDIIEVEQQSILESLNHTFEGKENEKG